MNYKVSHTYMFSLNPCMIGIIVKQGFQWVTDEYRNENLDSHVNQQSNQNICIVDL